MHLQFFPLFSLLENVDVAAGQKVVAARKLLFIEKLFAALLLAAPRIREQMAQRIQALRDEGSIGGQGASARRRVLLKVLVALQQLLNFWLPAVFRIGYLTRCCTWEGNTLGSSERARGLLEDCLLLLVHLCHDPDGKTEYVRKISVTLATWQDWHSTLPASCFAEESCEALLSRLSHRCSAHRHLAGFEATFDLFLTLGPAKASLKHTRGTLKAGLVAIFTSRLRRVLCSDGDFPFSGVPGPKQMHCDLVVRFPKDFEFPSEFPSNFSVTDLERLLRRSLMCLTNKANVSQTMRTWMDAHLVPRSTDEVIQYQRACLTLKASLKPPKEAKKRPRHTFMPKPRAKRARAEPVSTSNDTSPTVLKHLRTSKYTQENAPLELLQEFQTLVSGFLRCVGSVCLKPFEPFKNFRRLSV